MKRFTVWWILGLSLIVLNLQAQVELTIERLSDCLSYQVSLSTSVNYSTPLNLTNTAQVTLVVPTGTVVPGTITSHTGNWSLVIPILVAPPENPGYDYLIFQMTSSTTEINYQVGLEVPLFTFENRGSCNGAIQLIDHATDAFLPPNSLNANVGNSFVVLAAVGNAYSGNYTSGPTDCCGATPPSSTPSVPATTPSCLIEYVLEQLGPDSFQVSLISDTTWTGNNAITGNAQVSIRVPTGGFILGDIINCINTDLVSEVQWLENSRYIAPSEAPTWDYFSVALTNFTSNIPYQKGLKVPLFKFTNIGACPADSLFLIDNETDPFMHPNSEGANIEQQLTVSGWQMEDVPICVSAATDAACCSCNSTLSINPNPVFSVNTNCAGSASLFLDQTSTGNIVAWQWDFGDGIGTSTLPNPTYVYSTEGIYTVDLSVTFANNEVKSTSNTILICTAQTTVTSDPIFTASRACLSDLTFFSNTTSPANVQSWYWDFGDGIGTSNLLNPTYTYTREGTYKATLIVTYTDNTQKTYTQDVIVNPLVWPHVSASEDAICAGDCVRLSAQGGTVFNWSNVESLDQNGFFSPVACPTTTTTYTVTISDANGCSATESVTVTIVEPPIVDAGPDLTICRGDSIRLAGSATGDVQWSPVATLVNPAVGNSIAFPAVTTQYCLTSTNSSSCFASDCMTVTVIDGVDANAGTDQNICVGDAVQLTATGGVFYAWSPAEGLSATTIANPIANPTTTTTYCVTVIDANGCEGEDCITVNVNSIKGSISDEVSMCLGSTAFLSASGGGTYNWSPTAGLSNPTIANPTVSPVTTTEYCVTITGATGCTDVQCTTVTLSSDLIADAGGDLTICQNEAITLTATGGSFYQWSPSIGLSNINVSNPVATPTTTTEYCVTVSDGSGCTSEDCVLVTVSNPINANAGPDQNVCRGEGITLFASGGKNYVWSPTTGLSNSTVHNPVANPTRTTTYCVTVSDENGCLDVDCVNIIVSEFTAANAGSNQTICPGGTTQLFASGGSQYNWSPTTGLNNSSIANPIATPTNTTTYCVTVTDNNGCTDTDCMQVAVGNSLAANAGTNVKICEGGTTQLFATGGTTFLWSPSTGLSNPTISNPIATPSSTTTYCVTVSDGNGCSDVDCVQVEVGNDLTANAGIDQVVCEGSTAQLFASGGNSYQWSPSTGLNNTFTNNPIANPTTTTTYCVTVTDGQGCTAIDCVVVNVDNAISANAGIDQIICAGTSVPLNASGGITYQWSPTTGLSNSFISNPIANPNTTTNYCVTVSDGKGCTAVDCMVVSVDNSITVSAGPDQSVTVGNSVQLTASGGSNYLWSPSTGLSNPSISNPIASPNETTTYCVTVFDEKGCVEVDCIVVTVNNTITANAGPDQNICSGNFVQLAASGGSNYQWSPSTGLSNPFASNPIASPSVTTTYCVTVSDINGTSGVDCVEITVENAASISAGVDQTICAGSSTQLGASGGNAYQWSPTTGMSNAFLPNPSVRPNVTTTYCVTVTDFSGCSGVDCMVVTVQNNLAASAGQDQTVCTGGTTQLNASGGSTYQWSPTTGMSNPFIANPTVRPSTATTYCVTVTDGAGCTGVDCMVVEVGNGVAVNIGSDHSICAGSSLQLLATGGVSYTWSPTTGINNPFVANPIVTPTTSTTYCVTVTDAAGCTGTDCKRLTIDNAISVSAGQDVEICSDGSTVLNASGGTFYQWSPTVGLSDPTIPNPIANPTVTTTYCVTVTDDKGCEGTDCVQVFRGINLSVNAGSDQTICNGNTAQLTASGGLFYDWSATDGSYNSQLQNPVVNPSVSTTYCVTATNSAGCTGVDCMVVNVENGVPVNIGSDHAICGGTSLQLIASGGVSYQWSPANSINDPFISNPIITPTQTTNYCVTVTDAAGCKGTDCKLITVDNSITASAGADVEICDQSSTVLNASGGVFYEWSPTTGLSNPFISNPTANPTNPTTYCVTVTDVKGCVATDCVNVAVSKEVNCEEDSNGTGTPTPTCLYEVPVVACEDKTICHGESTQLVVNGGIEWLWTPSTGLNNRFTESPIASPLTTTVYTVIVTDAAGCTGTDQVIVSVDTDCTPGVGTCISEPGAIACEDKTICPNETIQLTVTNGASYQWIPASSLDNPFIGTPMASPSITTIYTVTVTDVNGCTSTDEVTVFVEASCTTNICSSPPLTVACEDKQICAGETIQINVTTGASYIWSPSTSLNNAFSGTPIASPTITTTYTVTLTDNRGCTNTDQVTVFVQTDCNNDLCSTPPLTVACEDKFICGGGSIQLNVNTGASYAWSPSNTLDNAFTGVPIASPSTTTTYTVTLTDSNGCTGTDEVIVYVNTGTANAGVDQSICNGTAAQLVATGGTSYQWSPSIGLSNPFIANPLASPASTTLYCVTATDINGCAATDCVQVRVGSGFPAVACEDKLICRGGNVQLTVTTGVSYQWAPAIGLSNTNTGSPIANPTTTTTYFVTVTDASGCTSVDDVIVNVDQNCTGGRACPEDILPEATIQLTVNNCTQSGSLCLPIEQNNLDAYTITLNGEKWDMDGVGSCQLNYSYAYTYFTIPDKGEVGPYTLVNWMINGIPQTGVFEKVEDLVQLMNQIDARGNWELDASTLTIRGGVTGVVYSNMTIEQDATNAIAYLNLNTNITSSEVQLMIPVGTYELVIQQTASGCLASTQIEVTCPTPPVVCAPIFSAGELSAQLEDCQDLLEICLDIPILEAIHYSFEHNGTTYQGNGGLCETGTGTAIYVGYGNHELIVTNQLTGCADTLLAKVDCSMNATYISETIAETEAGMYCIPLEETQFIQSIENICLTEGGTAVYFSFAEQCILFEGLQAGTEKACIVLCDNQAICDTTYLTVHVLPLDGLLPTADEDGSETNANQAVLIDVMANDRSGAAIEQMTIQREPRYGQVIINEDQSITYEPDPDFCDSEKLDYFTYEICNDYGCSIAPVRVKVVCTAPKVYNGFSPNGDGVNDKFRIEGLANFPNNELQIFNSLGSIVYQQEGYDNSWEGTFNHLPLPDGVYFYILYDGEGKRLSGYVQISR